MTQTPLGVQSVSGARGVGNLALQKAVKNATVEPNHGQEKSPK